MEADFSGYATRANVRCADGRTIMPDAFKDNDGAKVPLVFQHGHNSIDNVLGHMILENRSDGVYGYGFFNETDAGKSAKQAVMHGDLDSMSIYANDLVQSGGSVMHGVIREVSLVLAGANPEAKIDNVVVHSNGYSDELEDEVVIRPGAIIHAGNAVGEVEEDTRTVQDVLDTLNDDQRLAVEYFYGGDDDDYDDYDDDEDEDDSSYSNDESSDSSDSVSHSYLEGDTVKHRNVFERNDNSALSHAEKLEALNDLNTIIANASASGQGTLQEALRNGIENSRVLSHAIGEDTDYGINTLEVLFPEARSINGDKPEAIRRSQEWVNRVLGGVSKRPFTRIKMTYFDMTHEEARARGYIRGNLKKEMYWSMARRTTEPTTVYQKEKIDRDDIIDITNVDIVAWMWQEMRISLNEEIARAILFGDGREIDDPDKIREDCIRPICKEDDFYAHKIDVPEKILKDPLKMVDTIFAMRKAYKGSGSPVLYTYEGLVTDLLLLRKRTVDGFEGERYWDSKEALARALNVSAIVEIDDYFFTKPDGTLGDLVGIITNLNDYVVGTDKGGELTTFDDFDIDYNQYKYLIEGRMSGALIKPKSAIIIRRGTGDEIVQSSPMYKPVPTHEPTVPVGAKYRSTGPKGGQTKQKGETDITPKEETGLSVDLPTREFPKPGQSE